MGFEQWWNDYETRTDQSEQIAELLMDLLPAMNLDQSTTLLSVGPASAKIEDMLMEVTLKDIKHAYAVEPCPVFLNNFLGMMSGYQVKTTGYKKMIQDFEGTPEKVDLILVTHVAYYFHNSFRREMKKLMSMLSDNGALIFANKDDNHFNKALVDILPKANCEHGYTLLPSMDQFIEDFQAIGAKVQEFETVHSLDISDTVHGDDSYVSLLINRPVKEKEIRCLTEKLQSLCCPLTGKILLKDKVLIVRN